MLPQNTADPRLLCKNGHPIDKLKKLKAWQGHLHERCCNLCSGALDREDQRWRCSKHCSWNVCQKCYDAHWARVIQRAAKTSDDKLRWALLNSVPQARRKDTDFIMAGRASNNKITVERPRLPLAAAPPPQADTKGVVLWMAADVASTWVVTQAASGLLRHEVLSFPHPWLLVGLANTFAALICLLCGRMLGPPPAADTEWKAAGVLGLMYSLDSGLGTLILYHCTLTEHSAAFALTPMLMYGAGVLAGTEHPQQRRPLAAIAGVTLGGLLMLRSACDWSFLLLALLAMVVEMFRWVFTRNVLPPSGFVLPFATRVLMPAAAVGFELSFVTDAGCFPGLFSLPWPGEVAGLVLVTGVGLAGALVARLQLAHLTSLTVLGFATPLLRLATTLAALSNSGATTLNVLGAVCAAVGIGCYVRERSGQPAEPQALEPGGYLRIEDGTGRSPKGPGRSPGGAPRVIL